ncbi:MAG: 50S ribosomal protein L29 [Pseudomonadota bacterium]
MKNAELKNKTSDELEVLCGNFKKELFNLRFQKASGSVANTARFSFIRKTIARIKTMINNSVNGGKDA